jgi:acetyl-CoA C-acetyltransferase
MSDTDVVIVAAARTPQGKLKGQLGSLPATNLGAAAIEARLPSRPGFPCASTRWP